MNNKEQEDNSSSYSLLQVNEMAVAPLYSYSASAPEGEIIKVGDDLDSLSDEAFIYFQKEYSEIKTYEEWLSLMPDGIHDVVIADVGVGEIFRSSILIEDNTQRSFALAKKYHQKQKRKGGGAQYIIHIMMIARMLWALYQRGEVDRVTLLAGICHDLLEDTACPESEIEEICGAEVLAIVRAVSNDPELEDQMYWEQKKEDYIKSVETGGDKAMMVALCDKIVNMQSLFAQYNIEGGAVWSHFNRGKEKKVWFERNVLSMLQKHLSTPILSEYEKMITRLDQLDDEKDNH